MFDNLFTQIETAIDGHPRLSRVDLNGKPITAETLTNQIHEPIIEVSRGWFRVRVRVKLRGSRKRSTEIDGRGETVEAAVEHLITGLDSWAEAIE